MPEPQNDAPDPQSLSFEDAFTRLGEVAETLEAGGLPLAAAASLYEQGMGLARRCSQLLEQTELKIMQVRADSAAPAAGFDPPTAGPSDLSPGSGPAWDDLEIPPDDEDENWDAPLSGGLGR